MRCGCVIRPPPSHLLLCHCEPPWNRDEISSSCLYLSKGRYVRPFGVCTEEKNNNLDYSHLRNRKNKTSIIRACFGFNTMYAVKTEEQYKKTENRTALNASVESLLANSGNEREQGCLVFDTFAILSHRWSHRFFFAVFGRLWAQCSKMDTVEY